MTTDHSRTILDTVEAFLDTAPALEEANVTSVEFSREYPESVDFFTIFDGETLYITIDGRHYKVTVMAQEV